MPIPDPPQPHRAFGRRKFLIVAGAAGAGVAIARFVPDSPAGSLGPAVARWSDPRTWGGRPPGDDEPAAVSSPVLVDQDTTVAGLEIRDGGALVFDPDRSRTLRSTGNVVVRGRLEMHPSRPDVIHRLVFTGIDETRFEGGGMDPIDTDVGLWVMGRGELSLWGSERLGWARSSGAVAAGATSLTLEGDPTGWLVGDELAIAPTEAPTSGDWQGYDVATIAGLEDRTVRLDAPLSLDHPEVAVGRGQAFAAEVLNLTRNVQIEGTPEGRSHVFIRSSRPQSLRSVAVRYMGPRRSDEFEDFVIGRYGIHLHMCGEGSRGSEVTDVVVRDTGSHAFVAHNSHGVSFRRCVSHATKEIPYWWDDEGDSRSNDTLYDRCVASDATSDDVAFRLSGFFMGGGQGNVARGCVAVGIGGSRDASGFFWPGARSEGVWTFERCVAHNCRENGIFTWQNTDTLHVISTFVAYHNGGFGIEHGAYRNPYHYRDSVLFGNHAGGIEVVALSKDHPQLTFANILVDQAGMAPYCVQTSRHPVPALAPGVFTECEFRGYTDAALAFLSDRPTTQAEIFDVLNCVFSGNEFWLDSNIPADSLIRVRDAEHGSIDLRRADQPGTFDPNWNATVEIV